jgi:8-oxo-dGTP pyrophosphatase MutT (NUDIX family)
MASLAKIRRALAVHEAIKRPVEGRRRAAVAMVLRQPGDRPELLFIERAQREGDPWSGHMAFPGGRVGSGDPSARRAAERETLEEVGLRLDEAERIGRLDDMEGHRVAGVPALVISAFVYHVPEPRPLAPNHEVRAAFWFPVADLLDPERHVDYRERRLDGWLLPGILVGEPERHVVWGLTYRFLESFFEILGTPLPDRWHPLRAPA